MLKGLLILIKKYPIAQPLIYSVLSLPARLFDPALIFGTLEYLEVWDHPSRTSSNIHDF